MGFFSYLKDTVNELKKVSYPTKKETFKNTLVVLAVSSTMVVIFFAVDMLHSWLS